MQEESEDFVGLALMPENAYKIDVLSERVRRAMDQVAMDNSGAPSFDTFSPIWQALMDDGKMLPIAKVPTLDKGPLENYASKIYFRQREASIDFENELFRGWDEEHLWANQIGIGPNDAPRSSLRHLVARTPGISTLYARQSSRRMDWINVMQQVMREVDGFMRFYVIRQNSVKNNQEGWQDDLADAMYEALLGASTSQFGRRFYKIIKETADVVIDKHIETYELRRIGSRIRDAKCRDCGDGRPGLHRCIDCGAVSCVHCAAD